MTFGYIYVRRHPCYDAFQACKLGKALNIPDRDSQYATSEIIRGRFTHVFQVPANQVTLIEKWLHLEFSQWNIQFDAGTEFFHLDILPRIEPLLQEHGIQYEALSANEIDELARVARVQQIDDLTDNVSDIMDSSSDESNSDDETLEEVYAPCYDIPCVEPSGVVSWTPRDYQTEIIQKTVAHFDHEDKGMLVLACGVGKTLISLWTAHALNAQTILIGVPSAQLAEQWSDVTNVLFPGRPCMIVDQNTTEEKLRRFVVLTPRPSIIIALYASANKVRKATKHACVFDFVILDEAHHLTSVSLLPDETDTRKAFSHILKVESWKQLALTATLKTLDCADSDAVVSNDDVEHFGACIDSRNLKWAIEQGILCDYVVQTMVVDQLKLETSALFLQVSSECDKRLFLCAYSVLKSIYDGHSHHVLVYTNNVENSHKLTTFVTMLLDNGYFDGLKGALCHGYYHSNMHAWDRENALTRFKQAKWGVLTCVYCLGEGWDLPLLDAVAFAENMTSPIRIVQCALRACRKNHDEPNKVAKIILPILNSDDWGEDTKNDGLKKVRQVIKELGQQDDTIVHKFKVSMLQLQKQTGARASTQREETTADIDEEEDMDELAQRVKHFMIRSLNRSAFGFMTFDKARKLVARHTITTMDQYYALCTKYPSLSKEPDVAYKGQFVNWVDFFGLDHGDFYDLETCKTMVRKYLLSYSGAHTYKANLDALCIWLCQQDTRFPPSTLWTDYYNVRSLSDVIILSRTSTKQLRITI